MKPKLPVYLNDGYPSQFSAYSLKCNECLANNHWTVLKRGLITVIGRTGLTVDGLGYVICVECGNVPCGGPAYDKVATLTTVSMPSAAPAPVASAKKQKAPRFMIPLINNANAGKCTAGKRYEILKTYISSIGAIYGVEYTGDDGAAGYYIDAINCVIVYDDEPKKQVSFKCDCGGAKLGYPEGIMHSHWGHPKDSSKWCPMRKE